VCILYCGCFNLSRFVICVCMRGFYNVWVCVCMGFVMCGYVGVLVICVLVFTVFLYCFVYVYLFVFVTSVRTTATE